VIGKYSPLSSRAAITSRPAASEAIPSPLPPLGGAVPGCFGITAPDPERRCNGVAAFLFYTLATLIALTIAGILGDLYLYLFNYHTTPRRKAPLKAAKPPGHDFVADLLHSEKVPPSFHRSQVRIFPNIPIKHLSKPFGKLGIPRENAYESVGRGFESLSAYQKIRIPKWVSGFFIALRDSKGRHQCVHWCKI